MGFSGETLLVAGGGAGELTFIAVAGGGAGGAGEGIFMSAAAGGAVGGAARTSIFLNSESAGVFWVPAVRFPLQRSDSAAMRYERLQPR